MRARAAGAGGPSTWRSAIVLGPLLAAALSGCALDLGALEGSDAGIGDGGPLGDGGLAACGRLGEPCCGAELACDVGACLRGSCAAFGGVFSERACGDAMRMDCGQENPFTGGCSCPRGFQTAPSPMPGLQTSCDDGSDGALGLSACMASRTLSATWGGMWFSTAEPGVCGSEGDCLWPNPYNQRCGCGDLEETVALPVMLAEPTCAGQAATVGICVQRASDVVRFAGAFARPAQSADACFAENPYTGGCSCPEQADALPLALGEMVVVWCLVP